MHPNVLQHFNAGRRGVWEDVPDEKWQSWHWQQQNRLRCLEQLEQVVRLTESERYAIQADQKFRMSITPYYAALMDVEDASCPIRLQAIPAKEELHILEEELEDPLGEERDMPVPGITHRYPDRVLFYTTHNCPVYCRFCTRKRKVSDPESARIDHAYFENAIQYIAQHEEIRDVVISGGDPLSFSDGQLDWLLSRLRDIPHLQVLRLGSRNPVTLPFRITDEFVEMLRKYQPVYLNTHFNHPKECTLEAFRACQKLVEAGCVVRNQMVLLRGINDDPATVLKLNHLLLLMRVAPYYIYQCDLAEGISHFRTKVDVGLNILEHLWGHTSGMAIPHFVIDIPGGGGKIPLLPQYVVARQDGRTILRNYKHQTYTYLEPAEELVPLPSSLDPTKS